MFLTAVMHPVLPPSAPEQFDDDDDDVVMPSVEPRSRSGRAAAKNRKPIVDMISDEDDDEGDSE